MIQIDGTYLYGKYQGKLLVAATVDVDGFSFPLAFVIVPGESTRDWSWFLSRIQKHVTSRDDICFFSNRAASIQAALNNAEVSWCEPRSFHRFCLRHFCSSFNKKFKDIDLKNITYRAGAQHQPRKFDAIINSIKDINEEARRWLVRKPISQWSMAYDGGHRWGWMTTNIIECINGVLKGARSCPITTCVQMTYYQSAEYFKQRCHISEAMEHGDRITYYAMKKMRN